MLVLFSSVFAFAVVFKLSLAATLFFMVLLLKFLSESALLKFVLLLIAALSAFFKRSFAELVVLVI